MQLDTSDYTRMEHRYGWRIHELVTDLYMALHAELGVENNFCVRIEFGEGDPPEVKFAVDIPNHQHIEPKELPADDDAAAAAIDGLLEAVFAGPEQDTVGHARLDAYMGSRLDAVINALETVKEFGVLAAEVLVDSVRTVKLHVDCPEGVRLLIDTNGDASILGGDSAAKDADVDAESDDCGD